MRWLADNIPLISGLGVAFLSFLSSFIKYLNERNMSGKGIKKMRGYAEIYAILPDGTDAKTDLANLIVKEAKQILLRTDRKINIANILLVLFIASLGGWLSYMLASWAISSNQLVVQVLAWVLFAVVAFFALGISIAGLASIYEKPNKGTKAKS